MSDDTISTKIVATTGEYEEAMKRAAESTAQTAESIKRAFETIGVGLGLKEVIEGIKGFIEQMLELAHETEKAMAALGLTSEQIGLMSGVAKISGVSLETMTGAIEKMSLNVQRSTRDAFNPGAVGLKNLGLSAKELIGLPADQYFLKIADAVGKFNPSLNLTNNLMAIGGRGMKELLPELLEGGTRFRELQKAVADTGASLTTAQTEGFSETHEKAALLSLTIQGLKNAAFDKLKPAVDAMIATLKNFAEEVRDSIKEGGAWSLALDAVATAFKGIALLLASISALFRFLSAEVKAFWETTKESGTEVAADLKKNLDKIAADYKDTLAAVGLLPRVTITKKDEDEEKRDAPELNMKGKEALQAAITRTEGEIKLEEMALARKKDLYATDAANFKITESQKFALTEHAVAETAASEVRKYQTILSYQGLTLQQRAEYEEKIKQLKAKSSNEIIKLDQQQFAAERQLVGGYVDSISTSWNSSLQGMLAGTTSFKDAMRKVFADLVIYAIEQFEKMFIFEQVKTALATAFHVSSEATKTAATVSGVEARGAAETTGFMASIGKTIAEAMASIGAAVAKIFAELTAFLVPVFGPAAPAAALGIALGIGATAGALIAGVPKFEQGTPYVPSTGLAMLHQGERVLTKSENANFGGGDQHLHFHGPFVSSNSDIGKFASQLQKYLKDNPSKRT